MAMPHPELAAAKGEHVQSLLCPAGAHWKPLQQLPDAEIPPLESLHCTQTIQLLKEGLNIQS